MAVPSILRILPAGQPVGSPAEGPTTGRALVEIYGDGFRVPTIPPPGSGPSGPTEGGLVQADADQTVRVTFAGVEAEAAMAVRSNLVRVLTPISPLPAVAPDYGAGPVDVTVTNLDDNGDSIAGETVTLAGGYTYRRPKFDATTESDFVRLVRAFIREWKRQVLPEVVLTDHTDYDSDTSTAFVELAETPAIVLILKGVPENRFYSLNKGPVARVSADRVDLYQVPHTVDLEFDVVGISDSTIEILNMLAAAVTFMKRNPFLHLDRDPDDASKGQVAYELAYQANGNYRPTSRPNTSNLRSFLGSVVIRGFDVEGFADFADEIRAMVAAVKEDPQLDAESAGG